MIIIVFCSMKISSDKIIKEKNAFIAQLKKYCPIVKPFFELDVKLKNYGDILYDFKTHNIHLDRQKLVKEKINL